MTTFESSRLALVRMSQNVRLKKIHYTKWNIFCREAIRAEAAHAATLSSEVKSPAPIAKCNTSSSTAGSRVTTAHVPIAYPDGNEEKKDEPSDKKVVSATEVQKSSDGHPIHPGGASLSRQNVGATNSHTKDEPYINNRDLELSDVSTDDDNDVGIFEFTVPESEKNILVGDVGSEYSNSPRKRSSSSRKKKEAEHLRYKHKVIIL